uniref:Calpastatin n=1 Tax=Sinocyclocheilus grahami TaxID=75366 RepID=A0A672MBY7_SINGR
MGQIFSWIRGTRDQPALQDVAVEQQSQQVTPTPTSQVSTGKPAQYEVKSFIATVLKPTPAPSAKVPIVSSGTGPAGTTGVKPTDPLKDKAQSTTIPASKLGPAKVDLAVGKPSAPAGAQKQTSAQKVQVEVGPSGAKVGTEDVDPFDALSGTLPSSQPVAPKVPAFTGPEVKEPNVKEEKGVICGERDDTLPPGYRRADLPISTSEALDSLAAGFVSSAPPAPKKTDVVSILTTVCYDALSALGDTLGKPEPPKKEPELKPKDIVHEKDVTSKKGVRVGEREDTLPPDYRFSEEELKKYPPPEKEPSINADDALDFLSGGFTEPAAAPVVKAPVPPSQEKKKPEAVPEKTKDVPKPNVVSSSAPKTVPPGPPQTPQTNEDALSALGDTLGKPEPPKKEPELKPKDIVHEKDVTSKKGVRVGEREDTLPPDYRFSEEELKKYPPPEKEPSLDTTEAMDFLSGGFTTPSVASAPSDSASDFALDALAGDFVAPSSASKVQSAVSGPPHAGRQLSEGTSSAMDALSDTLADIKGAPEPAPVPPKDVVKEKNIVEERVSKPGERDDTLPPDHRFTEEDSKVFVAAKQKDVKPKQTSIDDTTALDMLSSDFCAVPPVKPSAPDAQRFTPEPQPPTFKASGPVFDELAEKVIPNLTDPKAKDSKPKKQSVQDSSATEKLPGKLSSDVVPSSSTKSRNL